MLVYKNQRIKRILFHENAAKLHFRGNSCNLWMFILWIMKEIKLNYGNLIVFVFAKKR